MEPRIVYERRLPGGGRVAVEERTRGDEGSSAHIAVERRKDPERRAGHAPPVIARAAGTSQDMVVAHLITIADSNVSVALGLLHASGRTTFPL